MKEITLTDFVKLYGQRGAAEKLGVTQPAVRKALLAEREIYVTENEDGTFCASEIKPFPSTEIKTHKAAN